MRKETIQSGCVVVGGGTAGLAAAITSARRGTATSLVTDRPVLGGNASKEIRVWLSGCEGGANNVYFRETGLAEEWRLDNLYRNPESNAEIWHLTLLDSALAEPQLSIFLNTYVDDAVLDDDGRIFSVIGTQQGSEKRISFEAELFVDATGDGTVGALAGVPFRRGREGQDEFGEELAPETADEKTLGGTILFTAKPVDYHVDFIRPAWAHEFDDAQLTHRRIASPVGGAQLWYVEWGGLTDTIYENEEVRHELLRIVYGIWDYIKNGDKWKDKTGNLTLEWVGTIPGKRESRRLEGLAMLTEGDLLHQTIFPDGVAVGGWSMDDHPPGGFFSEDSSCTQIHTPGVYQIPLRCLVASNVPNLYMAGRDASMSHVAMTSTRVMLTGIQMGEAVGAAAAYALDNGIDPVATVEAPHVEAIRQDLLKNDHWIVGVERDRTQDLIDNAEITASSSLTLNTVPTAEKSDAIQLSKDHLQMFPVACDSLGSVSLLVRAQKKTTVRYRVFRGDEQGNYNAHHLVWQGEANVSGQESEEWAVLTVDVATKPGWYFVELKENPDIELVVHRHPHVGMLLFEWSPNEYNRFSPWRRATASTEEGIERENVNLSTAVKTEPDQEVFDASQVANEHDRPYRSPNLWASAATRFEEPEWIAATWNGDVEIETVALMFNTDLDTDLRSLWMRHGMRAMHETIKDYRLVGIRGQERVVLAEVSNNVQRFAVHRIGPVALNELQLEVLNTHGSPHAQVYGFHAFGPGDGPNQRSAG